MLSRWESGMVLSIYLVGQLSISGVDILYLGLLSIYGVLSTLKSDSCTNSWYRHVFRPSVPILGNLLILQFKRSRFEYAGKNHQFTHSTHNCFWFIPASLFYLTGLCASPVEWSLIFDDFEAHFEDLLDRDEYDGGAIGVIQVGTLETGLSIWPIRDQDFGAVPGIISHIPVLNWPGFYDQIKG